MVKQTVKGRVSKLLHAGATSDVPTRLARRIIVTNAAAVCLFVACIMFIPVMAAISTTAVSLVMLGTALPYLVVIAMTAARKYYLGRLVFVLATIFSIALVVAVIGTGVMDARIIFLPLAGLPLVVFELRERKSLIFLMTLTICLFIWPFALRGMLPGMTISPMDLAYSQSIASISGGIVLIAMILGIIYVQLLSEEAEAALSNARYRQGLHAAQSTLAFIEWNTHGQITSWNQAATQVFGYEAHEVIGEHIRKFLPHLALPTDSGYQGSAGLPNFEGRNLKFDGLTRDLREIKLEIFPTALFDQKENMLGIACIMRDITSEIADQRLLQKQHAELVSAARMSTLMALSGGLAHEVNNPLAIISGKTQQYLARAEDHRTISTNDLCEGMHIILKATDRIAKIIRDIREFSTLDRTAKKELVTHENLARDIKEQWLALSNDHRHHLSIVFPKHHELIAIYRIPMYQAIAKLLVNAVEAVPPETSAIIEITIKNDDSHTIIEITDHGPGMSAETAARMMEPFFSTKLRSHNSGLGLAIARANVELHGGVLTCTRLANPTAFFIRLPIEHADTTANDIPQSA